MDIEINLDDVRLIMGHRFEKDYQRLIQTAYCAGCGSDYRAHMHVQRYWLNHLGDIILEGYCRKCGQRVQRYAETGVFPASYDQAMAIRELKIEVLRDYNTRPG